MSKQLAVAGLLTILRKGEPADPQDFKGVVRLQITSAGLIDDAGLNGPEEAV
jgi:hypothetical protein